ncbi:MAG: hypothetical protein HQ517_15805 [SAR324 cluster bacterium]|nr:hypothetical protein [SAR324 cluster bacterium]
MKSPQDPIIHSLVKKKKTLLNQLLVHSIQSAIDQLSIKTTIPNRDDLLTALCINDRSLEIRERELGLAAHTLEGKLFNDIKSVIEAIQENNWQTIVKLEKEQKLIEQERSRLGQEIKLSGYITQKSGYGNDLSTGIAQKTPKISSTRLLNGTL